ncbi:hypothetical protein MFIFM68171_06837 [Madurella fahalii]|uniref:Clr5 domain-containing protein n=1 Tax=Madurella fahalii TaxID=1157608 RepID=A0ABQ0GFT3_9PEZI
MAELTIINRSRPHATRISPEKWDQHRAEITDLYSQKTLNEVVAWMVEKHGFTATRRQYIHALKVWGVRKYSASQDTQQTKPATQPKVKVEPHLRAGAAPPPVNPPPANQGTATRTRPSSVLTGRIRPSPAQERRPCHPRLNLGEAGVRQRLLAEILFAFGDVDGAFGVYTALHEKEDIAASIFDLARTLQSKEQAVHVRSRVNDNLSSWDLDPGTWSGFFIKMLLAHCNDWDPTAGVNGLDPMSRLISKIVVEDDQGQDRLKRLTFRELPFDVPAYVLLDLALDRYNQCGADGESEIDDAEILEQFMDQQPAFSGGSLSMQSSTSRRIDCLVSCLNWCIEVLRYGGLDTHVAIPVNDSTELDEAYQVLCRLWYNMLFGPPAGQRSGSGDPLAWTNSAKTQLDISATELLTSVVCMIMSIVLDRETEASNHSLLERAWTAACDLRRLQPEELFLCFLNQVRATNLRLLALPQDLESLPLPARDPAKFSDEATATMIGNLREFAAEVLQSSNDLPPFKQGVTVFPLVLAETDIAFGKDGNPEDCGRDDESMGNIGDEKWVGGEWSLMSG